MGDGESDDQADVDRGWLAWSAVLGVLSVVLFFFEVFHQAPEKAPLDPRAAVIGAAERRGHAGTTASCVDNAPGKGVRCRLRDAEGNYGFGLGDGDGAYVDFPLNSDGLLYEDLTPQPAYRINDIISTRADSALRSVGRVETPRTRCPPMEVGTTVECPVTPDDLEVEVTRTGEATYTLLVRVPLPR